MPMEDVLRAIERTLAAEPGAAAALRHLWDDAGPPWERCLVAHYAADTVRDPAEALAWDERALRAASELYPGSPGPFGFTPEAMLPSLQLNIAENLRLLGDNARAAEHVRRGREALGHLEASGYGVMIRAGLDRLAARLEGAGAGGRIAVTGAGVMIAGPIRRNWRA